MLIDPIFVKNHLLLHITEDILMDNSRDFFLEFDDIITPQRGVLEQISIDFRDVRFLDSSGIGAIIKISNLAKEWNIPLLVLNLNKTLLSVFRLSGLENILSSMETNDFIQKYPYFREYTKKNHD